MRATIASSLSRRSIDGNARRAAAAEFNMTAATNDGLRQTAGDASTWAGRARTAPDCDKDRARSLAQFSLAMLFWISSAARPLDAPDFAHQSGMRGQGGEMRPGVIVVCLLAFAGGVQAQNYPTRPIRFIVPYVAGGAGDIFARTIGH